MDVSNDNKPNAEAGPDSEIEMDFRQAAIEDLTCCTLCGTELKFEQNIDYMALAVTEHASCPSCGIPLRAREHKLH